MFRYLYINVVGAVYERDSAPLLAVMQGGEYTRFQSIDSYGIPFEG